MMSNERRTSEHQGPDLPVGAAVAVRSSYRGSWSPGFEIAHVRADDHGLLFELRRRSDGTTLPVPFRAGDLRPA